MSLYPEHNFFMVFGLSLLCVSNSASALTSATFFSAFIYKLWIQLEVIVYSSAEIRINFVI